MIIEHWPKGRSLYDEEEWMLVNELQASLLAAEECEVPDSKIIEGS